MVRTISISRKAGITAIAAMLTAASLGSTMASDSAAAAATHGGGGPNGGGAHGSPGPSGPAGTSGSIGSGGQRNDERFLPQASVVPRSPCRQGFHCRHRIVAAEARLPDRSSCENGTRWVRDYDGRLLRLACEPRIYPEDYRGFGE
jgi:hypothetical protein